MSPILYESAPIVIQHLKQINKWSEITSHSVNNQGDTTLHLIASRPKELEYILSFYPEQDCIK